MSMTDAGEVKVVYPFASRLSLSNRIKMPDFERRGHIAGEDVYFISYHYTNSRDQVEEFCAAGVRPLKGGFGSENDELMTINFEVEGIDRPIHCPNVNHDHQNKARSFVRYIEQQTAFYYGRSSLDEHEQVLYCTATKGHLNRILVSRGSLARPRRCCEKATMDRFSLPPLLLPVGKRNAIPMVGLVPPSHVGGRAFSFYPLILIPPLRLPPLRRLLHDWPRSAPYSGALVRADARPAI